MNSYCRRSRGSPVTSDRSAARQAVEALILEVVGPGAASRRVGVPAAVIVAHGAHLGIPPVHAAANGAHHVHHHLAEAVSPVGTRGELGERALQVTDGILGELAATIAARLDGPWGARVSIEGGERNLHERARALGRGTGSAR